MSMNLGTVAESASGIVGSFDPFFDLNGNPLTVSGLTAALFTLDGITNSGSVTIPGTVTNHRYAYSFTSPSAAGQYLVVATAGTDDTGRSIVGTQGGIVTVTASGLAAVNAVQIGGSEQSGGVDLARLLDSCGFQAADRLAIMLANAYPLALTITASTVVDFFPDVTPNVMVAVDFQNTIKGGYEWPSYGSPYNGSDNQYFVYVAGGASTYAGQYVLGTVLNGSDNTGIIAYASGTNPVGAYTGVADATKSIAVAAAKITAVVPATDASGSGLANLAAVNNLPVATVNAILAAAISAGLLQLVPGGSSGSSSSGIAESPMQFTQQALAAQPINIVNIDSGTTVINS